MLLGGTKAFWCFILMLKQKKLRKQAYILEIILDLTFMFYLGMDHLFLATADWVFNDSAIQTQLLKFFSEKSTTCLSKNYSPLGIII